VTNAPAQTGITTAVDFTQPADRARLDRVVRALANRGIDARVLGDRYFQSPIWRKL
jgi:hypothetical protein